MQGAGTDSERAGRGEEETRRERRKRSRSEKERDEADDGERRRRKHRERGGDESLQQEFRVRHRSLPLADCTALLVEMDVHFI